jgi:hypothetical protein
VGIFKPMVTCFQKRSPTGLLIRNSYWASELRDILIKCLEELDPILRTASACSTAWRCKSSSQPDGGEVIAKRKGEPPTRLRV